LLIITETNSPVLRALTGLVTVRNLYMSVSRGRMMRGESSDGVRKYGRSSAGQ